MEPYQPIKLRGRDQTVRIACVADTHQPHANEGWLRWAADEARSFRPHVFIHLGDGRDCSYTGKHPTEDSYTIDEQDAALAEELNLWAGTVNADHDIYIRGNHDDRHLRLGTENPRTRNRLGPSKALEAALVGWQVVPYECSPRGMVVVGQTHFYHGYGSGATAWDREAVDMMNYVGWPGGEALCVSGHYHRPTPPIRVEKTKGRPLPLWYASPGTLGPMKPLYTRDWNTGQWGPGLLLIEVRLRRRPTRTREWEAHLLRP